MVREISKNIIIFSLVLIIIGLGYFNVFGISDTDNVKYKYYSDNLIKLDNDGFYDTHVNIVDNHYLGVLVSSDLSVPSVVSVAVTFYGGDGEELSTEQTSSIVFANNHVILPFLLPDLDDQYAGNIDVVVTGEEYTGTVEDVSNVLYEEVSSNPFTIRVTNNNDFSIMNLVFDVIAIKDDKIVVHESFRQNNVMPYSNFSVSSDTLTTMVGDYDQVLIFTTSMQIN